MILDFFAGETISDAAFRARVVYYYRRVRAGMAPRTAVAEAVRLIDRHGKSAAAAHSGNNPK